MRGIEGDQEWTSRIWFSDEAHFALNSAVNRRSNVYWGQNKTTEVSQMPLHSPKVTVWCAMSSNMVIGPFFFEDGQGNTVTVNQENYRSVLVKFVASLRRRQVDLDNAWFQQDGATPHAAIETLRRLQQVFGDRVISRRTNHPWSPHSPDLNPLDFFLWGYMKNRVYENTPATIMELKEEIKRVLKTVTQTMCRNTIQNFEKRVKLCHNYF